MQERVLILREYRREARFQCCSGSKDNRETYLSCGRGQDATLLVFRNTDICRQREAAGSLDKGPARVVSIDAVDWLVAE